MRNSRLFLLILALFAFTAGSAIAQESTEEPASEATEEAVSEVTEEAVVVEVEVGGTTYVIQPGDTFFSIAQAFGVSLEALAEANDIQNTNLIIAGTVLNIPVDVGDGDETDETPEPTEEAPEIPVDFPDGGVYIVQPGDTLFRIALRFGTTTSQLAAVNGITNPSLIFVGQELDVPGSDDAETDDTPEATEEPTAEPTEAPEATETPDTDNNDDSSSAEDTSTYTVRPGDSLFRIAVRNGTTVQTLLDLNPSIANANLIFVGQTINLPDGSVDGESDSEAETDDAESTDESATSEEDESLDVTMTTGVEVLLGDDYSALSSLATQLGVSWVKISVDWAILEPEQGQFDFAELDSAVNAFDANFDIMLLLTGAPDWARASATDLALEQPTYGPPDNLITFGAFVGEVGQRYADQVDAYEIWFQPNNRLTWMTTDVTLRSDGFPDARLSDVRYIDLLEVAYNALETSDPDATVLIAGLAPTGNNDFYNSIDNFVFFEELLRQGAMNYADGISVHIEGFSNAPDATCCGDADTDPAYDESYHFYFADTLNNYREILDRNGGSDMPLLVTRFGWGTAEGAGGDGSDLPFVALNTAQQQSDYISAAFNAGAERGDVAAMVLFNLNGCSVGNPQACYYSLLDVSGAARPAFNAVSALALPTGDEE